jgi:endonuclease/exonuclease/phosphatase (EEP) superfamily protein YafD
MTLSRVRVERAAWFVFAVTASAWLVGRFAGEDAWFGVLVAHSPHGIYLVLALVVVALAGLMKAWRALGVGVMTLGLAVGPLGGFEVSGSAPAATGPKLRVVQYNVNKWDAGTDKIVDTLVALAPDVFCLEEAGAYHWLSRPDQQPDALRKALAAYNFVSSGELMIGTKLPLVSQHVEPLAPGPPGRPMIEAVVRVGSGDVSVLAVHLIPTMAFEPWAEDRGEAAGKGLVEIARARRAQVDKVRAYATSRNRPVVVCGDFNALPGAAAIRSLEGSLDDAFRVRGTGFGYTAPVPIPLQRIDYVFVRGLEVTNVEVSGARTSDHHPVIADLFVR